ncbi:hypothetical protein B7494_g6990 [Chlorociboria aeruginascens]|nr:hypothetical protein B7494_g6990 [Chlorociboria aeruginascens]
MCNNTTINYTICGHQVKYRSRCSSHSTYPKQKCQKQDFESTYYHLCPECSNVASPAPLFHRGLETRSVFSDDTVNLAKEGLREAVEAVEAGLRKMESVGVVVRDDGSDVVNVQDSGEENVRAEKVDGIGLGLSFGGIGNLREPGIVASPDPAATAKWVDGLGRSLSFGRTAGLERGSRSVADPGTPEEGKEKRGSPGVMEIGKQKAMGKLKRIVGSLRGRKRPVVVSPVEDPKLQILMPTPSSVQMPSILEESPQDTEAMRSSWSSQQLAYEYQSIIDEHPSHRWSLSTDETGPTSMGVMKELPFENMNVVSTWAIFVEESIKRQSQGGIGKDREESDGLQSMEDKHADLDQDYDSGYEESEDRRGSLDEHSEC